MLLKFLLERAQKDSLQIQNEPKEIMWNKIMKSRRRKQKVGESSRGYNRESKRVSDVGEVTIGITSAISKTPNVLNVKELAIYQRYAHDQQKKSMSIKNTTFDQMVQNRG